MAALTPPAGTAAQPAREAAGRRHRPRLWRGVVGLIAALYFLGPLLSSLLFTVDVPGQGFTLGSYSGILGAAGFWSSLRLTLELAAATIAVTMLLLVPALIAVRLTAPRLRVLVEVLCSLPLVVPAVALTAGISSVLQWGPDDFADTPLFQTFNTVQNPGFPVVLLLAYVLMALPLAYRTLDAGLRALDLTTLVEAARNCGASWPRAVLQVVLPNLRGALLNTGFLTLALVLGEYTVASILGYQPFAVWIVSIGGSNAQMSVSVSVLSLVLTWVLLLLLAAAGRGRSARPPRGTRTSPAAPAPTLQEKS
ncbi:putative spermidine/putrescine transport system permease protein [Actinacidiphila yanglinensis]|uniref:Putative spermidine/putrescine transport system permease protein n=1 Tax=Actinacidiphila yanglinensis TaxID=310779 RepID=A0A1H6E0R0_9ACTN|nr:ABC transporter permease subunit [Actinacidiphila yanglinensis]SEG91198.1 putative spermidine/putrescine transport system permease protein [Actinacidiphila yanglinensis]